MWMWVLLLVTQTARVASSRPAPRVEIARGETSCRVTVGGELFTEYRWTEGISPVLYPVLGEGGIHMTRGWPLSAGRAGEARDHPHHRSLWFAHGEVNGNDFWSGRRGARIVQRELAIREEGPGPAIVTRNDWLDGDGKRVSRDRRRVSFAARDGMRIIDFEIEIEASDGALRFGDTKEGSMAIRMAPELRLWGKIARGKVRNSEGVSGKGVWGKRARWVAYQASLDDRNFGLALLDHPENHGYPCRWHARDYGLLAANPFGIRQFEKKKAKLTGGMLLPGGKRLTLRYRFLFFQGDMRSDRIEREHARFANEKKGN